MLRAGGKGRAPRRYAGVAAALGPMAGLILHSGDGLDRPARMAIFAALMFIPPLLVERFWRERERRQEERLLVLPERVPIDSASS